MKKQYLNRLNISINILVAVSVIAHFINPVCSESNFCRAYLDPSTGSMIISAIVGIFATIVLGIKTFWYKIVRLFKPGSKVASTDNSHSAKN